MYITKVNISNIRSISQFEMTFAKPSGWHVLIGDNGSGKSTIIRAISLVLVGPEEIRGIKPNWSEWLKWKETHGSIRLDIVKETKLDKQTTKPKIETNSKLSGVAKVFPVEIKLTQSTHGFVDIEEKATAQAKNTIWSNEMGWFSTGFGPFRRFTGGSYEKESVFDNPSYIRLAAHLSLFGEDVALTEATKWLISLKFKILEDKIDKNILDNIKKLINSKDFLPNNAQLTDINSEGVKFKDGYGATITVNQMSDGYRSILSLTFELIRQLVKIYGENKVFSNIAQGKMTIDLPGVVLIDEIDVHLHPTWQTRIGQWFTQYFPNIQFIVTTHSPLVCRACDNGSIWRLAAPSSTHESGEVTGTTKQRLVFGNVLDAYGTEIFGSVSIGKESDDKLTRLAELNHKSMIGETSNSEEKELSILKSFLTPIL